ncbi:hypothetical protein M0657_009239 [Pyricularia oryzae]|nr:hypothetical protein M0657_009239 [Pyricularia oryzae]KAI7924942.1 hypothetical protein M9X92_003518 [Pyricularia oryzae]
MTWNPRSNLNTDAIQRFPGTNRAKEEARRPENVTIAVVVASITFSGSTAMLRQHAVLLARCGLLAERMQEK